MDETTAVVTCSTCGKRFRVGQRLANRILEGKVKCPSCGLIIKPGPGTVVVDDEAREVKELPARKGALLKVRVEDGIAVARFTTSGLREAHIAEQLYQELDELLQQHGLKKVVLNMGDLKFMSSSVIGTLMKFKAAAEAAGGRVIACCIPPDIFKVFQIMRLDRLWDIRRSEGEALRAMKKAP